MQLPTRWKDFFEPAEGTPWLFFLADAVQRVPAIAFAAGLLFQHMPNRLRARNNTF